MSESVHLEFTLALSPALFPGESGKLCRDFGSSRAWNFIQFLAIHEFQFEKVVIV